MAKTATFGVMHLGTSLTVGHALTGSVANWGHPRLMAALSRPRPRSRPQPAAA